MPAVSVIVPVYQSESCISRCVESILSQSFHDYELILIDDGSTDQSGKICDLYAIKDSRITVIHQCNAGVSAARNRGLQIATGTYIVFVDSDDWISKNYLSDLMISDADFVCHSFCIFDEQGNLIRKQPIKSADCFCTQENILELLKNGALGYAVSKRYNNNLIKENNLFFDTHINHTEDTIFSVSYLQYAKRIVIEQKYNYNYIRYKSRKTLSNSASLERLSMVCTANRELCSFFFPLYTDDYTALYYSRIGHSYMAYIRDDCYKRIHGFLKTFSFFNTLLQSNDFVKVLEFAPDAVWKLTESPRIIRALKSRKKIRLFEACLIESIQKNKPPLYY